MNHMEASLRDMLRHGRKFERMGTDVEGVFIRMIPRYKGEPAYLAVEINPVGKNGFPTNKIGALIKSQTELSAIKAILSKKRIDEILEVVERINQTQNANER